MSDYFYVLVQFIVALGFVSTTLLATHLKDVFFPTANTLVKRQSFESGIKSYGNARTPFSVHYFLVAMLFVLFDVEVIFMYPWAVNFREMGMDGLMKMVIFMAILLVGFLYIIKKGALKWDK